MLQFGVQFDTVAVSVAIQTASVSVAAAIRTATATAQTATAFVWNATATALWAAIEYLLFTDNYKHTILEHKLSTKWKQRYILITKK